MDDHGHTGFTLVELLATLAIVAILIGIAVPAMALHLEKARLQAASEALVQELRQARNHAINYRRTVHFSYRLDTPDWCFGWSDLKPCDCRSETGNNRCASGTPEASRIHRLLARDFTSIRVTGRSATSMGTLKLSPVRGTATAASFILHSRTADLKVIISPLGRVRACSAGGSGARQC
ncbi:MAG: GspH/FimT family pseudopilin [Thiogranum sp.]|nr:GspH/FimT family pseudopilin [Thiogranum sp.]